MIINNSGTLALAYDMLPYLKGEKLIEVKRKIRRYTNLEMSDKTERIIKGDFDWYLSLITLPDFIETKEEAESYFKEHYFIPEPRS